MGKYIKILILIAVLMVPVYYRAEASEGIRIIWHEMTYKPCAEPISYEIGDFDEHFGISREDLLEAAVEAERLWESAYNRDLFSYEYGGKMKINLLYDYRQDTTLKLQDYSTELKKGDEAYREMKLLHEEYTKIFEKENSELSEMIKSYNEKAEAYEAEVRRANSRGGASQKKYEDLMSEKEALDKMLAVIRKKQEEVNSAAAKANSLVKPLNEAAVKLNLDIKEYNNIGQTLNTEFEQGNYRSGPDTREINIYQFDDHEKLVRVLAHEMGHALGVDHVLDPESIMYALNIGENASVSEFDLAALVQICEQEISFLERLKNIFR